MPHINELIAAAKQAEQKKPRIPYLSIKITGHDYIAAFKNKNKIPGDKQPDYKGDGIAVWINEYEPKTTE